MAEKLWYTYEEVATYLLNQVAEHFGVGRFEGKQVVSGDSGTEWEIDAKGCSDDGSRVIVVECKRHTKSGVIPISVINSDNMPCFSGGSWHGTSGRWSRACGGGTRVVAQREDS